jgi:hypothetical protein
VSLPLERLQAGFAAALAEAALDVMIAPRFATAPEHLRARLALYRANAASAARAALASAYPVVLALVGEDFFTGLARAYARAHPGVDGDLNRFGAGLAAFVTRHERIRSLPYLADVAALEWAVHRAHYAADAAPVTRDAVAAMSAADLLSTRFAVHPACAWIGSRFPIAGIWRAHAHAGVALPASLELAETALVVRPRWRADVLASSAAEIAALEQLRAGADMGEVIAAGLAADPAFDFPKALLRWIDHAVLVAGVGSA